MILQLRQRHRRVFAMLAVALPVAFAAGMVGRKPIPVAPTLPLAGAVVSWADAATVWAREDLFAKIPIQVELLRSSAGTGSLACALRGPKDFVKPDLLVYWVSGRLVVTDVLPPEAILLGSFHGGPSVLPAAAERAEGALILYSLADQEVVDASKPFRGAAESK